MRKLKFKDAGKASKILKKLQLRVDEDLNTDNAEALGASLFLKLAENYSNVENEVAEFMADLIEDMTTEKFKELELAEVFGYFEQLSKDEGLSSFLSLVGKMAGESN